MGDCSEYADWTFDMFENDPDTPGDWIEECRFINFN
jgi:hypothetical protein